MNGFLVYQPDNGFFYTETRRPKPPKRHKWKVTRGELRNGESKPTFMVLNLIDGRRHWDVPSNRTVYTVRRDRGRRRSTHTPPPPTRTRPCTDSTPTHTPSLPSVTVFVLYLKHELVPFIYFSRSRTTGKLLLRHIYRNPSDKVVPTLWTQRQRKTTNKRKPTNGDTV